MSTEDPDDDPEEPDRSATDGRGDEDEGDGIDAKDLTGGEDDDFADVRARIEEEADKAVEQFDQGIVDLLAWVLDTETRARIYAQLRKHPESTSDEVAEGTGLYPSTVREALADLHDEGKVTRRKRESDGAGNNPYEYSAIAPSDLVSEIVDDVQAELNTVFNLDRYLDRDDDVAETDAEPVTINVEDESDEDEPDDGWGDAGGGSDLDDGDAGTDTDGSDAAAGDEGDDGDDDVGGDAAATDDGDGSET